MEILEFGNKENKKIILIHGFQSPYQVWNEYIEYYKNKYHIIVPILTGHNPNEKEDFISFDNVVKEIEDYYISKYGNDVYAIYGMSMGGVVTAQLWQNKRLNAEKIIMESSPLMSSGKFMSKMLTNTYLMLTHKTQQRDKKVVEQAVGSIISRDKLDVFLEMMDSMSDETIINYLKAVRKYKLPNNINTPNTNVYYYYGTKINEMLAKKTAKYIKKNYPNSNIICFNGKGHCENSLLNPNEMIKELDKIL